MIPIWYAKQRASVMRARAKRKGVEFTLSLGYLIFLIEQSCYYCGVYNDKKWQMSIDRKDNAIGYTNENCVSACRKCNSAKRHRTLEEFALTLERKEAKLLKQQLSTILR